jgi:uncharacterized membrane protein
MLLLAIIRLGLTAFYSVRFSLSTMWRPKLISPWSRIKEELNIIIPIVVLSLMSITRGRILSWFYPVRSSIYLLPQVIKVLPLCLVILGAVLGYILTTSVSTNHSNAINYDINHFASCIIWFLVPLSSQFILKLPLISAHIILKNIDHGWLEQISGLNINKSLTKWQLNLSLNSPNIPSSYLLSSIILIITLILVYF